MGVKNIIYQSWGLLRGHSRLHDDSACPTRRKSQGAAETEPGVATSTCSTEQRRRWLLPAQDLHSCTCDCSQKVSGQWAGEMPCSKGWGGRCKPRPQTNKTLEKPFLSGQWHPESKSGSNKKLSSIGRYWQLHVRGAGVGVLGSVLWLLQMQLWTLLQLRLSMSCWHGQSQEKWVLDVVLFFPPQDILL